MSKWLVFTLAVMSIPSYLACLTFAPYTFYFDFAQSAYVIGTENVRIGTAVALVMQLPMQVLLLRHFSPFVDKIAAYGGLVLAFIVLCVFLGFSYGVMGLALRDGTPQRLAYDSTFIPAFIVSGIFWSCVLGMWYLGGRMMVEKIPEPVGPIGAGILTLFFLFPISIMWALVR